MTIVVDPAHQAMGTLLRQRYRTASEQFRAQTAAAMQLRGNGFEPGDAADLGAQVADTEQMDIVIAALRQQVLQLQDALDRYDAGRWGVCDSCHGPIPIERLEIMPWVTHCVPCQRLADRR